MLAPVSSAVPATRQAAPSSHRLAIDSLKTTALAAPVSSTLLVVLRAVAVVLERGFNALVKHVIMPAQRCGISVGMQRFETLPTADHNCMCWLHDDHQTINVQLSTHAHG